MGLFFALLAILSWGFGDFLIQRNARKFGDWISLFFIGLIGAIFLLPFVWGEIGSIFANNSGLLFLIFTSVILLIVAIVDFEALRVGKLSVVEPIMALEVLVTVCLSLFVLHESLTLPQTLCIVALIVGIFLVSTRSFASLKNIRIEKGVFLAIFATVGMGTVNFLFGIGARNVGALAINWFTCAFLAIACFLVIAKFGKLKEISGDWKQNKKILFSMGIIDNLAWVAYSFAALYMPIAIATSLTESYIALASLLGLIYNKEKLKKHQFFGMTLCVVAAIILAYISKEI